MKRFYYAISAPTGYPEERLLEIVDEYDAFSPSILAEPKIRQIQAETERDAAVEIIRQVAKEGMVINAMQINTADFFQEFSFYDEMFRRFPEVRITKYSQKKNDSGGHLT